MTNPYYQRQVTFAPHEFILAGDFEQELNAVLAAFELVPRKQSVPWTPLVGFETALGAEDDGDLSVEYHEQLAYAYRVDELVNFGFQVRFTPTFSEPGTGPAATSNVCVRGLPWESDPTKITSLHTAQIFGVTGTLTWPEGVTSLFGFITAGQDAINLFGNGAPGFNASFKVTNFVSASGSYFIRVVGQYLTDEAFL